MIFLKGSRSEIQKKTFSWEGEGDWGGIKKLFRGRRKGIGAAKGG